MLLVLWFNNDTCGKAQGCDTKRQGPLGSSGRLPACLLASSCMCLSCQCPLCHVDSRPTELHSVGEIPAKVFRVALGHWVPAVGGNCLCLPEVILIIARALSAVSLGQRINLPDGLCSVFSISLHSAQCSFMSLPLNLL